MSANASVEKILEVTPHPNADRLDLAKILGYQCVTQKGLYEAGQIVIYIRPDSLLPEEPWTVEYRKYSPSRIKAVKLRGEWSEGIIVMLHQLKDALPPEVYENHKMNLEGADVSEELKVTHWEPPLPQDQSAKGLLPLGIPKTDEERWENMVARLPLGDVVDVTQKIDGQSWSAYYDIDTKVFGICGRSLEYKLIEGFTNNYTAQIERYDIKNKLIAYCEKYQVSLCIRGESYGGNIQSFAHNPHAGSVPHSLAIFGVWLINERRRAGRGDQHYFIPACDEMDLPIVPVLEGGVILTMELIEKYSTGITKLNGKPFEGVVINHGAYERYQGPRSYVNAAGEEVPVEGYTKKFMAGSFKVINKDYDSKK
jgi:RNA ligase (TIGR02306 family)